MAQKIDQGAMAQSAHDKNIQARQDGGPGSGPKGGSGFKIPEPKGVTKAESVERMKNIARRQKEKKEAKKKRPSEKGLATFKI